MSIRSNHCTWLGIAMLALSATVCGCGNGGAFGLAGARAKCNESRLAGSGMPMTDAEWDDLVATHQRALDEGVSREFAIAFGNLTCGGESNTLCVQCNEALVNALWP